MTSSPVTVFDPGFEGRTVGGLLRGQAARHGDRPWAIFEDGQLTFGQADRLVDVYAESLIALGIGQNDRVGVMLKNSPEFLALALAVGRIGAMAVAIVFASARVGATLGITAFR